MSQAKCWISSAFHLSWVQECQELVRQTGAVVINLEAWLPAAKRHSGSLHAYSMHHEATLLLVATWKRDTKRTKLIPSLKSTLDCPIPQHRVFQKATHLMDKAFSACKPSKWCKPSHTSQRDHATTITSPTNLANTHLVNRLEVGGETVSKFRMQGTDRPKKNCSMRQHECLQNSHHSKAWIGVKVGKTCRFFNFVLESRPWHRSNWHRFSTNLCTLQTSQRNRWP